MIRSILSLPLVLITVIIGMGIAAAQTEQSSEQNVDCATIVGSDVAKQQLAHAKTFREAGNTDQAAQITTDVLTKEPNNYLALYSKGLNLIYQHDAKDSEIALQRSVDLQRKCIEDSSKIDYRVVNSLGYTQLIRGHLKDAEKNFKIVLLSKDNIDNELVAKTENNLGYLYFLSGKFDDSVPLLQDSLARGHVAAATTLNLVEKANTEYKREIDKN